MKHNIFKYFKLVLVASVLTGCNLADRGSRFVFGNGSSSISRIALTSTATHSSLDDLDEALDSPSTEDYHEIISQVKEKVEIINSITTHLSNYEIYCCYTDPHFYDSTCDYSFDEENIISKLSFLRNVYDLSKSQFVVCCGDVLCSGDTRSQACFKLSSYMYYTNAFFDKHYFVVGNHDTNYQGNFYTDNPTDYSTCILSQDTINSILFNGLKSYYYFDTPTTRHYCFDSGLDRTAKSVNNYQQEQILWFANTLLNDTKEHKTVFIHITNIEWQGPLSEMMKRLGAIINAFNDKKTIVVQNDVFDYSSSNGKIDFVQSGHIHADSMFEYEGIQIITTNKFYALGTESQPTFDIVLADYDNLKIYLFRIGIGEDRIITI